MNAAPKKVTLRPVGWVEGGRDGWYEDGWGDVEAVIRLDAERFSPDVTRGSASSPTWRSSISSIVSKKRP